MKLKTILTLAISAFALTIARADLITQTDTNSLAANSTNTFRLDGDITGGFTNGELASGSPFILCAKGPDLWLEAGGFFTNTTAGASNVLFRVAGSVSGKLWSNSLATIAVSVPPNSTNWQSQILFIPNAFPRYALSSVENANSAGVTGRACYLKGFVKEDILKFNLDKQ